ncbi:putative U-box domain-containing protein 42 [Phtheirospermum japonicum]|uniref:RING-type E3 ubiquitin transferase n=1 Tax=Phtheirospermum japonicum TaxID=374723 RepID=A0A830C6T9_9LAMI|nr:putative U-box domain-containing protein 42 [Phtheirospermum japonicum]
MGLPDLARYMEPLYETFFCPLTKRVMDDPVTVASGVTYERKAIIEWFDVSGQIVCPKSGIKLKNVKLSTNLALKATIDEWKERNEAARIKVARAALSLASSDDMVLEAIDDLRDVCMNKVYNKVQVRSVGIIPLLGRFLEYRNRGVRHATLAFLRQLAEDDEESKDIIAETLDISEIIKMLSSSHKPVRHASASLLVELSSSQIFCNKIGTVAGGVLMLITAKFRQSDDALVSETADEILTNLEKLPENIKLMAENGYWEPLLTHLVEGNEEMKTKMATYLALTTLGPDNKTHVAQKASPPLIQMIHSSNPDNRKSAFKALKQISSHHPNAKTLVEANIMQTMVAEIFTRKATQQNESKIHAAEILANILESGLDIENVHVSKNGHTMGSDYIVYNIVTRIKNSAPDEMNINLIRILIKLLKLSSTIISVIKESEASYNLIELINTPNEELFIASTKLLIHLSGFMGHTLSDMLCKTKGQPESLIENLTDITERHAVSAIFLAKLPHQNLTLNLSLVNSNTIFTVVKTISQIQTNGIKSSRHASTYLEGLVGILVRLTTTLYDHQIIFTARTYNLVSIFTELLTRSFFTDEVHRLSAIGLENLSRQSVTLSRPPQAKKTKTLKLEIFRKRVKVNLSKGEKEIKLCRVHGGVCSSRDTFCLLDGETVERLIMCLDHESGEVIGSALSALSTLLDDRVNIDESVRLLCEKCAVQNVMNVVKEREEEMIRQRAFWMVERLLMNGGDGSVSEILLGDRLFPAVLVSDFHHGDDCTRRMAENILRHLNKMPDLSNTVSFTM